MDGLVVDLSRLQFATTTLFHYLFVPLTLGLSPIVAFFETRAAVRKSDIDLRLAKFFGSLLLINFAMGVVTGIVQEFQFGMNWAGFSRFVGDIVGGPLVMEGMFAFFLESTFLGLWLFGRDRLPRPVHVACIWLVAIGTWASAYFILTVNSWMQHPVGFTVDQQSGRAIPTDFGAILTQDLVWLAWGHAVLGGLVAASVFVFAVAAYHLKRRQHMDTMQVAWKFAIVLGITVGAMQGLVGDVLGVRMVQLQPMKMSAAEAVWETEGPCAGLSIIAWPDPVAQENRFDIEIPCLLSIVATNSLDGQIIGMKELQAQAEQQYGPGYYIPSVWIAFYAFRAMIGFGLLGAMWMVVAWWRTRKGRLPTGRWFWAISIWMVAMPWLGNMFGWVFTENGRQPWIVYGQLKTVDAASDLSPPLVVTSLVLFVLLYGAFAIIEFLLMRRYVIAGPADAPDPREQHERDREVTWIS